MTEPMLSAKARVVVSSNIEFKSVRNPSTTKTKTEPEAGHPWMIPDCIRYKNMLIPSEHPTDRII